MFEHFKELPDVRNRGYTTLCSYHWAIYTPAGTHVKHFDTPAFSDRYPYSQYVVDLSVHLSCSQQLRSRECRHDSVVNGATSPSGLSGDNSQSWVSTMERHVVAAVVWAAGRLPRWGRQRPDHGAHSFNGLHQSSVAVWRRRVKFQNKTLYKAL